MDTLTLVPEKVGGVIGTVVQQCLSTLCPRKARRKDKEPSTPCPDDPKLYLEEAVLERKLPDIDLRVLVDLPAGLDYNEWLASHTIAFFDHINLVYGTISEFCTMSGCPDMTGPGLRNVIKKESTKANEFPSSFESIVRKILRLLFHVLAHLYHCHFREVVLLNLHAHLNCVFAHLTLFNHRFQLIELKETEILQDLVLALKVHSDASVDGGSDGDAAASSEGSQATCEDRNTCKPDLILTSSTTAVDESNEEKEVRSCESKEICQDNVGSSGH
ncbi:MOB kinase activator-like 2 [Blattella germanica]|nr:MOB kinase activator-like 2 [Blattella germanica]